MLIATKYYFGDKVYILKEQLKQTCCKMCEGKKTISVNNILCSCPVCYGKGVMNSSEKEFVVKGPYKIDAIQIYNSIDDGPCIFYSLPRTAEGYNIAGVIAEDNIFPTYEEASEKIKTIDFTKQ